MSEPVRGCVRRRTLHSGEPPKPRALMAIMLGMACLVLVACGSDSTTGVTTAAMPAWIEGVYPEPGATLAVPDAVEVDHILGDPETEIRLLVDGVDVTIYAEFDAATLRYRSGDGPVELSTGVHTAEVQRVALPADGSEYTVIDSFAWEFRVG